MLVLSIDYYVSIRPNIVIPVAQPIKRIPFSRREKVEEKLKEMKKDIEIQGQTFERVFDSKESDIKSLVDDLLESEEQYLMAHRTHLQNIDELTDFQTEPLSQMEIEFDKGRDMLVQQNQLELTKLQGIIFVMTQNFDERDNEAKHEFQSIREELKNKNLEAKHALGMQLETAMKDLWAQFQSSLRNYQETTEEKKAVEQLNTKHEKGAMINDIGVGDRVILGQSKRNKLTTRFEKEPYDVVERDGNAMAIQSGEEPRKMRNIAHMKKLNGCPETSRGQTMTSIPVGNSDGDCELTVSIPVDVGTSDGDRDVTVSNRVTVENSGGECAQLCQRKSSRLLFH